MTISFSATGHPIYFGDGQVNGVMYIYHRMTPDSVATKFETKWAIGLTQLV